MKISEIEGLSFAELKARRADILAGLDETPEVLAKRYLQARTDAAMRDEKLAEQGVKIKSLSEDLAAAEKQKASLEGALASAGKHMADLERELAALQTDAE